jgi:hypothetical protein
LVISLYKKKKASYNLVTTPIKGDALSMNSITQFKVNNNSESNNTLKIFSIDELNIGEVTDQIKADSLAFNFQMFLKIVKEIDDSFFSNPEWRKNHVSKQIRNRTVITSIGEITFARRGYYDLQTKEYICPVDEVLKVKRYQRVTDDAIKDLINMTVDVNGSYAARNGIPGCEISKQTICNILKKMHVDDNHDFASFVKSEATPDTLYIQADEAHCNLQQSSVGEKISTVDPKSDCEVIDGLTVTPDGEILEDFENTRSKSYSKNRIVNFAFVTTGYDKSLWGLKRKKYAFKRYFTTSSLDVSEFADDMCGFITNAYNPTKLKTIFVSGDGGSWITKYYEKIKDYFRNYSIEVVRTLDGFHYTQYLRSIFNHDEKMVRAVMKGMKDYTPETFRDVANQYLKNCPDHRLSSESFTGKVNYICNNLEFIKNQNHPKYRVPCSMEGHVYHYLATRLTTNPKCFCEHNLEELAQLLVNKVNGDKLSYKDIIRYTANKSEEKFKIIHCKTIRFDTSHLEIKDNLTSLEYDPGSTLAKALRAIAHPKFSVS